MDPVKPTDGFQRVPTKPRFVPNMSAALRRPSRAKLGEHSVGIDAPKSTDSFETRGLSRGIRGSGRGRGRSTKGAGLLQPAVISGPFAQGPGGTIRHVREAASLVGRSGNLGLRTSKIPEVTARNDFTNLMQGSTIDSLKDTIDECVSLETWISNRKNGLHLPVMLNSSTLVTTEMSMRNDMDSKAKSSEASSNIIQDDDFVDSRDVSHEDCLMLFQLPSCLPMLAGEGMIEKNTNPSSTSLLGAEENEKAMDIDTFKSIREASETLSQKPSSWPQSYEGHFGKLRIHASGRISVLINGDIYYAVPSTFKPDITGASRVVAIDPDYQQSFDLGNIHNHYIFVPEVDLILNNPPA